MCGEIWLCDFGVPFGSEPGFRRPVLVIQNDVLNNSKIETTFVIPFTTNLNYKDFIGNTFLSTLETGLTKDSVVLAPQAGVIDKERLLERIGKVSYKNLEKVILNFNQILG